MAELGYKRVWNASTDLFSSVAEGSKSRQISLALISKAASARVAERTPDEA
jgi:hypothetical protein